MDLEALLAAGPPTIVLRAIERGRLRLFLVHYANRAALQLLQLEASDMVGNPLNQYLGEAHRLGALQRISEAYVSGKVISTRILLVSAQVEIPVIAECNRIDLPHRFLVLLVKPLQQALLENIETKIIEAASNGDISQYEYWLELDPAGRPSLVYVDPGLPRLLNVSGQEFFRRGFTYFVEPSVRRQFGMRLGELMAGRGGILRYQLKGMNEIAFTAIDYAAPIFVEDHSLPVAIAGNVHVLNHNVEFESAKQSALILAGWLADNGHRLFLSDSSGRVLRSSLDPVIDTVGHVKQFLSPLEFSIWDAHCLEAKNRLVSSAFTVNISFDSDEYTCRFIVLPQNSGFVITIVEFNDSYIEERNKEGNVHYRILQLPKLVYLPPTRDAIDYDTRANRATLWTDEQGIVLGLNKEATAMLSSLEPDLGQPVGEILSDHLTPKFISDALKTLARGTNIVSLTTIKLLGLSFWQIKTQASSAEFGVGQPCFEIAIAARRYRGPPIVSSAAEQFRIFANAIAVGVAELDDRMRIVWCNNRIRDLLQIDPLSLIGRSAKAFLTPAPTTKLTIAQILDQALKDPFGRQELMLRRFDNSVVPVEISLSWLAMRGRTQFVLTLHDITLLRHSEETIRSLAYYDGLTGLPNRVLFYERLSHAIDRVRRERDSLTLMLLDLSRFGLINESLGLEQGDQLLRRVGERLRGTLRQSDTVARLGADEFIVLLYGAASTEAAVNVASKLLGCFDRPFRVNGHEISIKVNLGITMYPGDAENGETLIRNTNSALARAKEQGSGRYHFYTSDMNDVAFERLILEGNLRRAIEERQFELYYQPQISVLDGGIVGFEALLRWFHPDHGQAPAYLGHVSTQYLRQAEQTELAQSDH
ncbi:MAG: diguanylate cyclase, partial [Pseudomonadota bacterium]